MLWYGKERRALQFIGLHGTCGFAMCPYCTRFFTKYLIIKHSSTTFLIFLPYQISNCRELRTSSRNMATMDHARSNLLQPSHKYALSFRASLSLVIVPLCVSPWIFCILPFQAFLFCCHRGSLLLFLRRRYICLMFELSHRLDATIHLFFFFILLFLCSLDASLYEAKLTWARVVLAYLKSSRLSPSKCSFS